MKTRYIPQGSLTVADPRSDAVVFTYERAGALYAIGYCGKRAKPDFHYRYHDEPARTEKIRMFFEGRQASLAFKAKMAAERKERIATRKLKVGDILNTSWGYEQTNVEFFEVTALVGDHSVELRELASNLTQEEGYSPMAGFRMPKPGKYVGEPVVKRDLGGSVKFASYRWGHLWDGRKEYTSWYG